MHTFLLLSFFYLFSIASFGILVFLAVSFDYESVPPHPSHRNDPQFGPTITNGSALVFEGWDIRLATGRRARLGSMGGGTMEEAEWIRASFGWDCERRGLWG